MAKIISASVTCLTRPHVVLTTSYGEAKQERTHAIVTLTDEDGRVGYGETTPLAHFNGETAGTATLVLQEVLLPALLGLDCFDIAAAHQRMDHAIADSFGAKSAADCAMYDLAAKTLGVPLYALLGGKCRDNVPINRHMGIVSTQEAENMAKDYAAQGFLSLKLKVGGNVDVCAERIAAVRRAVGPKARIRVDGNCGFSYPQAVQLIRRTEECRLEFYEQLLPKWDMDGMRRLRKELGAPILADESVNSVRDAMEYALHDAADAVTIKLCKCGGLYPALRIAAAAEAAGMQAVIASTYDTHIGCSACLHLASALPNAQTACDLTTFATQPIQAESCHTLEGMYLHAGSEPGIGLFGMYDYPMKIQR